ncbi:hypothetical protein BD413DRAFT_614738 [Trametes elegans]|nr:hypothetical protein BD413DRAFT_614738 [Trametes elegans]
MAVGLTNSREAEGDENKQASPPGNGGPLENPSRAQPESSPNRKMTIAEMDVELMDRWKERQGSLANAEFEDGQVAEGYRRNVKANIFRYI